MKRITVALVLICAFIIACKPAPKALTPELFLEIENQIIETDQTPESKKKILNKYKITLKQYDEYLIKVESDPQLKAKLGDTRLKKFQGEKK